MRTFLRLVNRLAVPMTLAIWLVSLPTARLNAAQISFTSLTGNWTDPVDNMPGSQTGDPAITNGVPTSSINWGVGTNGGPQSGYDFTRTIPGPQTLPPAPTPLFPLGEFTHRNFPISSPSLTSVKLDVVTLLSVDGVTTGPLTFTFTFTHDETPNNQTPCPYPTPSGEGCTDRVTFVSAPQPTTFNVGGVDYTLSMSFVDDNGNPVAEFFTRENLVNTANLVGQFTVAPPVLNSLTPNTTMAGSPTFIMRANGSLFVSGATVLWNGISLPTIFVNSTRLDATVPSSLVAAAGTANVHVQNPDNQVSVTRPFTILPAPAGPPPLDHIRVFPSSATLGAGVQFAFNAQGYDANGVLIPGILFNWAITGPNTLSASTASTMTVVTAGATPGLYTLTASSSGINGQAIVAVQGGGVSGGLWLVDPASANPNPVTGTLTHLHVLAQSTNPGPITYRWDYVGLAALILNPNLNDTNVTFTQPGTYLFKVTITDAAGLQLLAHVSVPVIRTVTQVIVSPSVAFAAVGQTFPFTAVALDQFNQAMPSPFNWGASAGSITGSGSFVSQVPVQNVTISAAAPNGVQGTARMNVLLAGAGGSMDLSSAKAYPVPYKATAGVPGITFSGLTADTRIRIFSSDGRLVQTLYSSGPNVLWDVLNKDNESLASGVYFYRIDNGAAGQVKEGKLVIIQ